MADEKPNSYRDPQELDHLFLEYSDYIEQLVSSISLRRDVETFTGGNLLKESSDLQKIIDKLNLVFEPLSKAPETSLRPAHVKALVDALLALIEFTEQKGPVKPEIRAKLEAMANLEYAIYADENHRSDSKINILSLVGMGCEICMFNILNAVIFLLNAGFSGASAKADDKLLRNPRGAYIREDPLYQTLEKKHKITPHSFFMLTNRIRASIIAAGIVFMTCNSANKAITEYDQIHIVSNQTSPALVRLKAILLLAISATRMAILYLLYKKARNTFQTNKKVDFACYLRLKLDEAESGAPDQDTLGSLKKLYHQLSIALKHMEEDPLYDPTPLIIKIREALEAVNSGEQVHVRNFLKDTRKTVKDEHQRQISLMKQARKSDPARRDPIKRAIHLTRIELPPIKKSLTRQERKDLHAMQKAGECSFDTAEQVQESAPAPITAPSETQSTPITTLPEAETNSTPITALPESQTIPAPIETASDRETVIRKICFQRTLDRLNYRRFLKALGFRRDNGGKGSHEKHTLQLDGGSLVVIVSLKFSQFDDNIIKSDLLKKTPALSPEWVYWKYCRKFAFPESIVDYPKFFSKEYDPKQEPSRI